MFNGWQEPQENWSKLPHEFFDVLDRIETIGELKVILYILRHTWGYHDAEKKITLDEFAKGRKRRDGERIDSGTGLSRPTILSGLTKAEAHGFISIETDTSDKARVKKFYSLSSQGLKNFTPDVKELYPSSKKTLPRTEKETKKTNNKKETIAAAPSHPPITDFLNEWKRLFPNKPQPRQTKALKKKWATRFKDDGFEDEWLAALTVASRSPTLQNEKWFNAKYFLRSEETWTNCLDNWMAWKDEKDKPKTQKAVIQNAPQVVGEF